MTSPRIRKHEFNGAVPNRPSGSLEKAHKKLKRGKLIGKLKRGKLKRGNGDEDI